MPRYVIERNFGLIDDDEMQELAARSKLVGIEQFPDIEWEHSHVCNGGDGGFKSYCVYRAANPDRLRDHATRFGGHVVNAIYEIVGDVTPDDIRV
jgi:hypothetical protein